MPTRQIQKNKREIIHVSPTTYEGHELINIRVYAPAPGGSGEYGPTKKGLSIAIDRVPDLIDALLWALGQPCTAALESDATQISPKELDRLSMATWDVLRRHGSAVHWDSAERMVLGGALKGFSKWDLHYVLASRPDLFERTGNGCYRAKSKSA